MNNGDSIERKFPANLEPQSFPDAVNEFLRCQLGRHVREVRRIKLPGSNGHVIEETMWVSLFHLLGYGSTWEAAEEMALHRLGIAKPTPARDAVALFFGRQ